MALGIIEFIALTAAMCSILSILINIVQWRSKRNMEHMFYSHLFALYNHMGRVGELNEACKREYKKSKKPNQNMTAMIRHTEQCIGISESVKRDSLGMSERYFGKSVWRQKQNKPDEKLLQKAGKLPKTK